MREQFEKWYLQVIRGNPANLLKDEGGGYKYLAAMYLGWEAATLIEREACARVCETQTEEPECPERAQYCADAIRMRSNVS
jgi:hypothetical protein